VPHPPQATAKVQAGETVLVTAAAGGTGQFAVQLAKLAGCRVVAVCGSEAKAAAARQLGADEVIDYRREDLGVGGGGCAAAVCLAQAPGPGPGRLLHDALLLAPSAVA
jgi:NADPH:quinone reductase-like Zn-dependent oxidoreductase